jgi:hypothetical protein
MSVGPTRRSDRLAASQDPHLIEIMAEASYERWRTGAPHLPAWPRTSDAYRDATRQDIRAALAAAEASGFRFERVAQSGGSRA